MPKVICRYLSTWKGNPGDTGFTLIELLVVVALITIMMAFSFPRFDNLLTNETRQTSQWIVLKVPELRNRAASENQVYTFHADMAENRLWFSGSNMNDDELKTAMDQGLSLSDSFFILDVSYGNGELITAGDAPIFLYPKGYSSKAILHMEEGGGDRRSFIFEPFLSQVEIVDGYVDYEN